MTLNPLSILGAEGLRYRDAEREVPANTVRWLLFDVPRGAAKKRERKR